jgi:hypothetical protein
VQDVAVPLPLGASKFPDHHAFDRAEWYGRRLWGAVLAIATGLVVFLLRRDFAGGELHLFGQILIYMAALFAGCMVCHGERYRPAS